MWINMHYLSPDRIPEGIVLCLFPLVNYKKGFQVRGLETVDGDILVFHAGTESKGAETVTSGGRVLGITALADSHEEAKNKAYENVRRISFEGMQYREDIGLINKKSE